MGTLPLDFEQDSPPSLTYLFSTNHGSLPRDQISTPWPPSTPPLKSGLNWVTMGPPPPASLWPRPLLALLNSTTNIVVSMLVMKILTSTLPMFSIPSSWSTTVSLETSSTPLTWMPPRSPRTLTVWSVTGPRAVVSSTMPPRPSWSGSMRRINSVSSPCKRVVMSRVFSSVLPWVSQLSVNPSRLNLARTSKSPPNSVISTLAQPTWELVCVLLSTLTSPAGPRTPLTL